MKAIGKIGVYIFLIFFLFFIGLLIQQVFGNEQMRPTWLTMVFSLMGPYLFTYSKWANDNIWNTKTSKPNNKSNTSSKEIDEPIDVKEIPKEVNQNLNPNNNNTLLYIIIGILVIILIAVLSNPESQQTNSNKRETIEREKIPREKIKRETITRKEIETTPVQVEQRVKPKSKPKSKPKPKSAWFNSDNDDPFAEIYAYSNGVVKSYDNVEGLKPKIKVIKEMRMGLVEYKTYITDINLKLEGFDISDYYLSRGEYNKSRNEGKFITETQKRKATEKAKLYMENKTYRRYVGQASVDKIVSYAQEERPGFTPPRYGDIRNWVEYEVVFEPSKIKCSNYYRLGREPKVNINEIRLDKNCGTNTLSDLLKSNDKMFVKLTLKSRFGGDYVFKEFDNVVFLFEEYLEKTNPPSGLFDGESYIEFSLSGSTRAISNAK